MNDFLLFMHDDVPPPARRAGEHGWNDYIAKLASSGRFSGGSSIGSGCCFTKDGTASESLMKISGFLRVQAETLEDAKALLEGNPAFEAGGTVEIRELPRN